MEAIDDDHSMLLSAHDGGKDVKTVHLPRKKVCKFFFFFLLVLCFDSRETPTTTECYKRSGIATSNALQRYDSVTELTESRKRS